MMQAHTLPEAPRSVLTADQWQIGVYRTPFELVEMSKIGWKRYRLKEWHYLAFTTDEWFIALGLVQLGYVANLFAYVIDRVERTSAAEHGELSPFGIALSFAPSSVRGRTSWRSRGTNVTIDANMGWDVELDIPLGAHRLRGNAHVEARESLAMLHRLGPRRVAYTHKAAGWPASGRLELGPHAIRLDGGLAASDWTRSQASRITEWKWASFSATLADGTPVGLNLSAQVYEDENGHSVENAFWSNGRVQKLRGVVFDVPADPKTQQWRIRSIDTDEVDLEFDPIGAREEHTNFGLVRTDFVQPYGCFTGRVCGQDVSRAFGVVETHLSVW